MFNSENRDFWQKLADNLSADRPSVGKTVTVSKGKWAGVSGVVFWHGVDRYYSIQYKTDAQLVLMEMTGRYGYRVGIKTDSGKKIFVSADNVTVN